MASSPEFVNYVCEQLEGAGAIRFRKMFGEYTVYVNDKPVVMICDDTVYMKQPPCLAQLLAERPTGAPYQGAKEHYILDPDDGGDPAPGGCSGRGSDPAAQKAEEVRRTLCTLTSSSKAPASTT